MTTKTDITAEIQERARELHEALNGCGANDEIIALARALTEERRRALRDFLRVIDCTSSNPIDYAAAIAALRREAEGA